MSVAKETIRRIQHVLARKGYNPGVIDGIWGRNTDAAVRAFQVDNGLVADGIVGATTSRALFGDPLDAEPFNNPAIPWFQEARRLIGVKEVVGPGNNPEIIDWASDAGIGYDDDDIPWCGLFVAHCVSSTLTSEPLPGNPLGARQWQKGSTSMAEVRRTSDANARRHPGVLAWKPGWLERARRVLCRRRGGRLSRTWRQSGKFRVDCANSS